MSNILRVIKVLMIAFCALTFIHTEAFANESSTVQAESKGVEDKAEDRVELKTSFIKGNKELPQVLYIVPWQEIKKTTQKPENMVLHSLYGNVFQPITAEDIRN